jgi:isopropylmalate/homocitrate/citramalate synthase
MEPSTLTQLTEKSFALPIQFHKPIVGDNTFTHEVDEHVEGMLAHPLMFEPFPPEIIGRETALFVGRNTGQTLLQGLLEKAGIRASPRKIDEILSNVKGPLKVRQREAKYLPFKKLLPIAESVYCDFADCGTVKNKTQMPILAKARQSPTVTKNPFLILLYF